MRKGQKNFVTTVANIDKGELLEIIDSHKQQEIIEVLMQQPLEVRELVTEVSVDMWGGFTKVIEAAFPNAVVVYDRFHVMKKVNEELNKFRKKIGITVRGSKYLLLKNKADLESDEQIKLEEILKTSICLRFAYEWKEELRDIYETSKNVKSGQRRLKKWLETAQVFYGEAVTTIRNHFEGICNYFISRSTTGVMEGINTRIKLIMRQGYGFSNFDNFRSRLMACFSN